MVESLLSESKLGAVVKCLLNASGVRDVEEISLLSPRSAPDFFGEAGGLLLLRTRRELAFFPLEGVSIERSDDFDASYDVAVELV